jgi:MFS family permease
MTNPLRRALDVLRGYAALPKGVLVLCLGTMINNLGNFVSPFLTIILTERAGLSAGQTGLFVTLSSLVALGGILLGGKLTDAIGRKTVLTVFTGLAVAAYLACALAVDHTFLLVGLLMVFSLVNAIAQPVQSTIMMDITPPAQRQQAFSLHYLSINAGYAAGPLLASFLYAANLPLLFLLDAATTLVALLLAVAFVPESHPDRTHRPVADQAGEVAEKGSVWSVLLRRPQLLFFIFVSVLFFLVFSQFNFGLSLQARSSFGSAGLTVFGLMMTVNALGCVVLTLPVTYPFRRSDPLVPIVIGSIFYALGFGMLAFVRTEALFLLSTLVWTLGEILVSTSTSVYLAGHTPSSHRGRFNAIFPVIRRVGFAVGPALSGLYAARHGIVAVWLPTGALALTAGLLTLRLLSLQRKGERREKPCPSSETVV